MLQSVESSLERLGLDRLDIAYLHDPDEHWEQASTTGVDALVELRDQGVVGAIGAGMNQSAMLAEFVRRTDVDIMMVAGRYTLLDQSARRRPPAVGGRAWRQRRGRRRLQLGHPQHARRSRPSAHFDYGVAPSRVLAKARRIQEVCATLRRRPAGRGGPVPTAAARGRLGRAGHTYGRARDSSVERATVPIPEEFWAALTDEGLVRG